MNIEIKVKESAELVLGLQNYMFCFELQNALSISKIQTLAYFIFFICTYYRENFVTFGGPSIMPPVGGGEDVLNCKTVLR